MDTAPNKTANAIDATVAFLVAISHNVSVDTKTLRFFNPDGC
jgi:hypothetical protein